MAGFFVFVVYVMFFQVSVAVGKADDQLIQKCQNDQQTQCWKQDK